MKDLKVYLFMATVCFIFYLLAEYNRPKAIDWTETLSVNEKTPFGTYVLFNRLNDIFPNANIRSYREPVYNVLTDHGINNGSYIIICDGLKLDEYDYKKLIQYLKNGNNVFIAASDFGDQLRKKLKIETQSELRYTTIFFSDKSIADNKSYTDDKNINNGYFKELDTTKVIVLGKNNLGNINFIKINIGKGSLYLNANPLMFSNYAILNKQNSAYASTCLSYLADDKTMLWDEYYSIGREGEANEMRVFLRQIPLKWALYISFFSLLIFVLFEIKRRQRIIPVIEPLTNSTLEFVNVVGQVYYEKRNNANIAHKKILYLLEHLRDEYQLKTNKLDNEFIEKLAAKLGIDRTLAYELVDYIKYIANQQRVTDHELIELNKLIEKLYIQSR